MRTYCVMLSMLLLAACSSDDEEVVSQQPSQKRYPLTIEVAENPLITEGGEAATRAAVTTTSTLKAFKMGYVYKENDSCSYTGNAEAEKDVTVGKWKSSLDSWPQGAVGDDTSPEDSNINVSWYAYAPYTNKDGEFQANNGSPYITFQIDENSKTTKDLLVSKKTDTWKNCQGHLFFRFDHACAALRFYLKKATNINDYTLSISKVKLYNVINKGNYYFNNNSPWSLLESRTNYTLYESSTFKDFGSSEYQLLQLEEGSSTESGHEETSYHFVIPQTLTAWDKATDITPNTAQNFCYLELECSIVKSSNSSNVFNGTAYYPFGTDNLTAGYQYDVKINIGKNSLYSSANTKIIN